MILLVAVVKCSENITPAQTVHTSDREIEMPDMLQKPCTFASSGNFLVNVTVNKLDAPRERCSKIITCAIKNLRGRSTTYSNK
jgi:hypothetical protein